MIADSLNTAAEDIDHMRAAIQDLQSLTTTLNTRLNELEPEVDTNKKFRRTLAHTLQEFQD